MPLFDYNINLTGDCQTNGGGTIILTLSGGTPPYSVNWINPDLNIDTTYSSSTRTGLSSGTYVVEVNDSTIPENSTFLINIPVSSGMCVTILNTKNTSCGLNNGSITGTSTCAFSYAEYTLYSGDGTSIETTAVNSEYFYFDNLQSGIYYIVGIDLGGCTGYSETFIIEESSPFDFGLYSVPNSTCNNIPNGKIYVTGQTGYAPYTYLWSNNSTDNTITGLTEGIYSVEVIDSKGCSTGKSAIVEKVEPIGFGFSVPTPPTCFASDGSILFYTTGGTAPFCYSGSNGSYEVSYSREYVMNGLSSGNYSLHVRDAGLCTYVQSVYLEGVNTISSVEVQTTNSNCSNSDGSVTIAIVGGSFPYNYFLINSSGETTSYSTSNTVHTFTGLTYDMYTVGVSDTSGCTFTDEVVVFSENKFTITADVVGTTCGNNNGSIYVYQTTGGTAPYYYYIDGSGFVDNSSGYTFTNVPSGEHTIDVIDSTGCKQTTTVTVPNSTFVDFSLAYVPCFNGQDGGINAFITNGTPPFTFIWSDNVPGNPQEISVSGLSAGTYSLTVIDINGCNFSRSISLECDKTYTSYQIYPVYDEPFVLNLSNKRGMLQLLNEGFNDLTSGNTDCSLINAKFLAEIEILPSGYTDSIIFYTSEDRTDAPYDNLWYESIKTLLLNLSAIEDVIINPVTNTMIITSKPNSTELLGQIMEVKLRILYDIICVS